LRLNGVYVFLEALSDSHLLLVGLRKQAVHVVPDTILNQVILLFNVYLFVLTLVHSVLGEVLDGELPLPDLLVLLLVQDQPVLVERVVFLSYLQREEDLIGLYLTMEDALLLSHARLQTT